MVRKLINKNSNKQNNKQNVVVKIHIGDKQRKKGKRLPRKRGGGGVGTAQPSSHQYTPQYTPVYIQSGNPPPPPQADGNALLTAIKEELNGFTYKHKEEIQNPLHKQVGAKIEPTPAIVKAEAKEPLPAIVKAEAKEIKTEPLPAPKVEKTIPTTPTPYKIRQLPLTSSINSSSYINPLHEQVQGKEPAREFVHIKEEYAVGGGTPKPILHYKDGRVYKSSGYEEDEPYQTPTSSLKNKPVKTVNSNYRRVGIAPPETTDDEGNITIRTQPNNAVRLNKNGQQRKPRADKGMPRGTYVRKGFSF